MIAYKDDLSFRRIVNTPKRNMGRRRMSFLEETSSKLQCSLYDALLRTLDHEIFKGTKAAGFVQLIESFSSNYAERTVSELLSDILNESGYEEALRTEGSQERLDNLAELKQSVYEFETSCGEEATMEHYLSHVALFSNASFFQNFFSWLTNDMQLNTDNFRLSGYFYKHNILGNFLKMFF
jgi:DNA helicase-2/ATP-dependent DNA helicase PcrA